MSESTNRRTFLLRSTLAGGAVAAGIARGLRAGDSPQEAVVLGIIGTGGRGTALATSFASLPGTRLAYVCDVDARASDKVAMAVADRGGSTPKVVADLRRILDDRTVDAVVIATPDHWHGPATVMACAAGKHVYVEKPASHNPREGELMVEAARKYGRAVQLGTQRRSMPGTIEAIQRLRAGEIGRVLFARGWYNANRPPIGHGKPATVPASLDYSLWQGPAPERAYRDNLIPYNWHWFWHWGTGELGNNGIHSLDLCRWGLEVDIPRRVTASGGKYFFHDDQETPDTHVVTYDFGESAITWEGRNWHRHGFEGTTYGCVFYGDRGSLVLESANYKVLDPADRQIATQTKGFEGHDPHLKNFLAAIRSGEQLNAPIEQGHKSTLLCQLGNIAYRTTGALELDPASGQALNNAAAQSLWTREYRNGWEPKV
ncbi:MAG TPA: Gfo/Idh/MocA family oxidoreductase [Pirellulales bacterium]|nr:Gfo/Idh/MocA family oxidoreductase [Pirellulales bacterium]